MNFRPLTFLSCLLLGLLTAPMPEAFAAGGSGSKSGSTPAPTPTPAPAPISIPTTAVGPTIVYHLSFDSEVESINYRPYEQGYYVAPAGGGVGTLILTRQTGTTKSLYLYASFGELFVARDGSTRKAVISCTAASTVSASAYFAMGDATESLPTDNGAVSGEVFYAPTLTGYAVTADSQGDAVFQGFAGTSNGVAGNSEITFSYDEGFSENARVNNQNVATVVAAIQKRFTDLGYAFPTAAQTPNTSADTGITLTAAPGDIVVYKLTFSNTSMEINFKPYKGGFYVASAKGGTGTLLLTTENKPRKKIYHKYTDFGTLFVARSDSDRKGVMFATAANTVSTTTFFGMGDANQTLSATQAAVSGTMYYAKKLFGYALSADDQSDLPFFGNTGDIGVAGAAKMTATYDEEASHHANNKHFTVALEVADLEKELVRESFDLAQ